MPGPCSLNGMAYPYQPQSYQPAYQPRTSAPFSVHFVAFFIYLGGLFILLGALAVGAVAVGATQLPTDRVPEQYRNMITGVGVGIAVFLLLFSLLYFLIARKLQRGRQWARILVLILSVLGIIGGVLQILAAVGMSGGGDVADQTRTGAIVAAGASLIGPVLFTVLLNTSAARSWFRYRTY